MKYGTGHRAETEAGRYMCSNDCSIGAAFSPSSARYWVGLASACPESCKPQLLSPEVPSPRCSRSRLPARSRGPASASHAARLRSDLCGGRMCFRMAGCIPLGKEEKWCIHSSAHICSITWVRQCVAPSVLSPKTPCWHKDCQIRAEKRCSPAHHLALRREGSTFEAVAWQPRGPRLVSQVQVSFCP